MDHGQRAAGEVAEAVGEVGVVAADQRVVAEAAVLPEDDFAQQEIAQGVRAHHLADRLGADDVAARLAHLVVLEQQPAVREDALRQRQPAAIRNAGQKTAWKRRISLPIRCRSAGQRPSPCDGAHVVDQRVEPDVEDVRCLRPAPGCPI